MAIDTTELIGKRVTWEKIGGKPYSAIQEKHGFGALSILCLEYRMVINGNEGLSTSPVKSIEKTEKGIEVKTRNSTYLIKVIENE